ncbi:DUF192 domain-containing protein [Natronospira bacteriovora]|uniref:DUF192 domain-containing protein n=1 Tax=Natronospira bacteriovora TaxID=3069753 RepID=A0ABU0W869_9GAMM|nr:DUF192 domain-containing protein [Natronospira sp. AB-CW4]MDQ2069655.1 DUF192 domain-containing protein [Natronospira sp. AB-CW4]
MKQAARLTAPALLLVSALLACAGADNDPDNGSEQRQPQAGLAVIELTVGGQDITAELADTHDSRQTGLMHREALPEHHGMLFVYPRAFRLSFWMKNTPLPLDIAFIDRSGFIVDIQSMEPHSTRSHQAPVPIPYALEMNQGWFEANDVSVGDRVTGLPSPLTAE